MNEKVILWRQQLEQEKIELEGMIGSGLLSDEELNRFNNIESMLEQVDINQNLW